MATGETLAQKQWRLRIESENRRIAEIVKKELLPGTGFALFVFDFGDGGAMSYMSNANRDDMRKAVQEWLDRTK